jgi:hypothetical protein
MPDVHGILDLPEPPWAVTLMATRDRAQALARSLQAAGAVAPVLRGSRMTTLDAFFDEVGAALRLPDYFGRNWPALHECLTDLSWLPGDRYAIVVAGAQRLFEDDAFDSLRTFLELIRRAGASWAAAANLDKPWGHGSVPFHVVLQVPPSKLPGWKTRLERAGMAAPDL